MKVFFKDTVFLSLTAALLSAAAFFYAAVKMEYCFNKNAQKTMFAQALGQAEKSKSKAVYFKRQRSAADYKMKYGFSAFGGGAYKLDYSFAVSKYKPYIDNYGYSSAVLKTIDNNKNIAIANLSSSTLSMQKMAEEKTKLDKEARSSKINYLHTRGFKGEYKDGVLNVQVDTAGIVGYNVKHSKPLAKQINALGFTKLEEITGAVLSFTQTSINYEQPPLQTASGLKIGGFWPPVKLLVEGGGDCDSKTVLMASVLKSWPSIKTIGVRLPTHYLIGIRMLPRSGHAYIRHNNDYYVLAEPAGPARLDIGKVGNLTAQFIKTGNGFVPEAF